MLCVGEEGTLYESVSVMKNMLAACSKDIYFLRSVVCKISFNDCGCKTIVVSRPFFIGIFELTETCRIKWNNDFI